MASEEGIRVRISGDNAALKRSLEEAAGASKAFQEKMLEHMGNIRDTVKDLCSANGLGMISNALTGPGSAADAAKTFADTLVKACKEGMAALEQVHRSVKGLGRALGSPEAGQELSDWFEALPAHRGDKAEGRAALGKLADAGYGRNERGEVNLDEVEKLFTKLQDLAKAGYGVSLTELVDAFASAKQEDFEPLVSLLRNHVALARKVREQFPEGLTASDKADWSEAEGKRKEAEALQQRMDENRQQRAKLAREAGQVGSSPAELADARARPLEEQAAALEWQGQQDDAARQQTLDQAQISRLTQEREQLQARLSQLAGARARTPQEAERNRQEMASGQARLGEIGTQLGLAEGKPEEDALKTTVQGLRQRAEAIRKQGAADQKALEESIKSADLRDQIAKSDREYLVLGQKLRVAEGERVTAENRALNEPQIGVAKAIRESPDTMGPRMLGAVERVADTAAGAAEKGAAKVSGELDDLSEELKKAKMALAEAFAEPVVSAVKSAMGVFVTNLPPASAAAKEFGEVVGGAAKRIGELAGKFLPELKPEAERGKLDDVQIAAHRTFLDALMGWLQADPRIQGLQDLGVLPRHNVTADAANTGADLLSKLTSNVQQATADLKDATRAHLEGARKLEDAMNPQQ